jgi:hypothetical protein
MASDIGGDQVSVGGEGVEKGKAGHAMLRLKLRDSRVKHELAGY